MIIKNDAVILAPTEPKKVLDVLPNAKFIRFKGRDLVAVKHELGNTKILRNLGFAVPSPIKTQYRYTGRFQPMKHQYETAEFLTLHTRCFVLNEMGTGKTSAALWAADYLRANGYIDTVVVVCPMSVMKVWADEAFSVTPHRSVGLLQGKREKRIALLEERFDINVINFDGLTSIAEELAKFYKGKRVLYIIDEASAYRTATTQRYKALKKLIEPQTWLWLMTGTPTPNAPTDAWGLVRLVSPHNVPKSFNLFRDSVMRPVGPYKWVPKPHAQEKVWEVMQPAVRYRKQDCLDLPPVTYNDRHCELSSQQRNMFETLRKQMKYEEEGEVRLTAANAAVKMIKLQQVCCGIVKDDNGDPIILDPAPRLDLVMEMLEEIDGKVIIFAPFKFTMDLLLQKVREKYTAEVVNGDTPNWRRDEIFHEFQNGTTLRVLIAHPATTAHGLTLTAAADTIWYAPIFSIEQYEQANARTDRKGQTRPVSIYHIGASPFEWAIYKVLQTKAEMQSSLLALYRGLLDGSVKG